MGRRRARWRGAVVAALALAGAGVWAGNGALLLAAGLPLSYLAYGAVSTASVPAEMTVSRAVEPTPAPPGHPVSVRVTVTNESEGPVSDLRVVDGVPRDLSVIAGSPRSGETLAAGESLTLEYTLIARRGDHDFEPPRLRARGTGAAEVATAVQTPDGDDRLVCRLDAEAPPLSDQGNDRVGQRTTSDPGDGFTFHSTREYRRGDPVGRIDWRSYAKRGELSTVNYEQWVSTAVVFVLDARPPSRVTAGPGRPTAVELGAYATTHALTSLLGAGHEVGLAVVGIDGDGPGGLAWIPPGNGSDQRSRAIDRLEDAAEAAERDPDGEDGGESGTDKGGTAEVDPQQQFRKVMELAGPRSQFVLVSPILDDGPVTAMEGWAALDAARTVLSPDVTAASTVSGQHEHVRRRTRLARCQATGARTIDWQRGTPLPLVLDYAFAVEARRPDGSVHPGGGV
ncbi:DUF58 domain-containing protein [Haloarcula mannanilytica]|uniref:DUF58 domain-containing protein n=1 Tax=Haloarcula mannanilytica TaxID=2509225 RepID=A0A4C2ECC8_9EURY|nr:DUF58 domain-containing protein [Haloarcula mannanilytica]GCF12178.1 DUF58 domain-containing protein [Haloarcula mannanilytica]